MRCRKNEDIRWTKKHDKNYCGYDNHITIDKEHRLIRRYAVMDARVRDSQTLR